MDKVVEEKTKPPVLPPGSAGWNNRTRGNGEKLEWRKFLNERKNFTVRWPSTGTGCSEGMWSLLPWGSQNPQSQGLWTQSPLLLGSFLSNEVGLDNFCVPSNPAIPGFWDSHAAVALQILGSWEYFPSWGLPTLPRAHRKPSGHCSCQTDNPKLSLPHVKKEHFCTKISAKSAQLLDNFIDYNWLLLLQPKNFTQNSNYTIQHETARDTDPLTSLGKNQRAKSKTGSHQAYSLCSQPRLINAFNGSLPLLAP